MKNASVIVGWNTGTQFAGKAVSAGIMFLISLLIAGKFGAAGFGDFTKITTFIALFYLFADFGLNAVYLQKESKAQDNWLNLLGIRMIGSIFLIICALIILTVLPWGTTQGYTGVVRLGVILYSPTILLQGLITTANALFQKYLRYDLATLALVLGNLVSLVLVLAVVGLVKIEFGAVFSAAAFLGGTGTIVICSLWLSRRWWRKFKFSFDLSVMKQILVLAVPLGLMLLFNQVYFRFDNFVITLTRSTIEVGIYGLAYKIFELPLVLPTFFMNALFPLLLTVKNSKSKISNKDFYRLIKKSFIFLVSTSFLLTIIFWVSAPLLMFIRPEFAESVKALRVLVLGLPFFFTSSLFMWLVIVLEKQKVLPLIYGFSMIFVVLLDSILIPKNGYLAAAWITVAAEGMVLALLSFVVLPLIKNFNSGKLTQI